jgi:hypothetical protein
MARKRENTNPDLPTRRECQRCGLQAHTHLSHGPPGHVQEWRPSWSGSGKMKKIKSDVGGIRTIRCNSGGNVELDRNRMTYGSSEEVGVGRTRDRVISRLRW